ncbi:hypothetical protein N4G70_30295 [Streptomyces sp. ASQP_92]|uniref:hypothetical protein n=1 Tax=Streptomyces sp. ASQP_92 TaxID=2979116 RepID=UPI0021BEEEA3|nr:hypothetical protein [Streptomyces sp. ASQP_92]MCT9093125.1 hypothetical protein [Streptomyces sp. ASQP_92]
MPTISDRSSASALFADDLLSVLAGAALAASAVGAALALADSTSPLRAPLALFFLVAAPAEAAAFSLRRLEPLTRAVASLSGAVLIDLSTAESMTRWHLWSIRNGIATVGAISLVLLLWGAGVRRSGSDRERSAENTEPRGLD